MNCVVTIDLSKALDLVNHQILIRMLKIYQLDNNFVNLIRSYLTDRKQLISINGSKSQYQRMYVGVPQGSILGPLILFYSQMILTCFYTNVRVLFMQMTQYYKHMEGQ